MKEIIIVDYSASTVHFVQSSKYVSIDGILHKLELQPKNCTWMITEFINIERHRICL